MAETPREQVEQDSERLSRVLARLQELYEQSALQEKSDEERIIEGMYEQIIGPTTKEGLDAIFEKKTRELEEVAAQERWSSDQLAQEIKKMKKEKTEDMFAEHFYESTLLNPERPISSATYGTSMFLYDLRMLMGENPPLERFQEFGWVMFDMNALRSYKDCKGHKATTLLLKGVARILGNPEGPTNSFLREQGIRIIPMATGGDEFELYLRGQRALTPALIGEVISSFQNEVSSSENLRASLDYDDESVLITYGLPSSKQRKEFAALSAEDKAKKLASIREGLPGTFIPSMAGGGVILDEGTLLGVEKDEHDLLGKETFHSLREKIVQSTIDLAEEKQKRNKKNDLKEIEIQNPKEFLWRQRNGVSRSLLLENIELRKQNQLLQKEIAEERSRIDDLLQKN